MLEILQILIFFMNDSEGLLFISLSSAQKNYKML